MNPDSAPFTAQDRSYAIADYQYKNRITPDSNVVYFFSVNPAGALYVTHHEVINSPANTALPVAFQGAVPGVERAQLVDDIVQQSMAYADDARRRMGLHAQHRIVLTVPAREATRPLFQEAEAALWTFGVVFDWSLFDTWTVAKSLSENFDPDDMLTMTPVGWRLRLAVASDLSRDEVLILASRMLRAQDVADNRNRRMTAVTDAPPVTDGPENHPA